MLPKPKQKQTQKLWLQTKLGQCCTFSVAGASGISVGGLGPFRGFVLVERPWSFGKGNGDGSRGWNVGRSGSESGGGCCGEAQGRGGDCGGGGSFFRGVAGVDGARWQQWCRVVGSVWKVEAVLMMLMVRMRGMEQEEADRWSLAFVDLIENCRSSSACGSVRAGISCGGCAKVISNADHQYTSDLVIERNVTDLCWLGNDVTVSYSVILKCTNAGRELQRNAMQKEALANADSSQEDNRRQFDLVQIVESIVDPDRRVSLYDPKFYSVTFKRQVFDAQSLRLVESSSATSSQPDVLQYWQPNLYRGSSDSLFQSFMVLYRRSIWTLWLFFLLQWMKSVVLFQFR